MLVEQKSKQRLQDLQHQHKHRCSLKCLLEKWNCSRDISGGRTKLNLSHARSDCTVGNFSLNFCHMPTCSSLCFPCRQMTNDVNASHFHRQTPMWQSSVGFVDYSTLQQLHNTPTSQPVPAKDFRRKSMQPTRLLHYFLLLYIYLCVCMCAELEQLLIDDYDNWTARKWPKVKHFLQRS